MAAIAIANDRPRRNLDHQVLAPTPKAVGTLTMFSTFAFQ